MNVVLYSREDCSYCTRAKMILATRNIPYKELKLNEDYTKEHLLELYPSATTFPVVVVDGFNIGGFTELAKMLTEQKEPVGKFLTEG
jgi:glutaredoxin